MVDHHNFKLELHVEAPQQPCFLLALATHFFTWIHACKNYAQKFGFEIDR